MFGIGDGIVFRGVACGLGLDGGMIQSQSTREAILAVLHGRGQLLKDFLQIIRVGFQRDNFCLRFGILGFLLFLDGFKVMVGVALQLKGFLDQFAGVGIRGKGVGLDDQLPAVPVFRYHIFRNIGCRGRDGQHTQEHQ
ncbi:hypothetical protein [Pseudoflavonifractor phocaeensis]|uniref:hypothetical protein n=1 Tax=Pseudoflavonifractor phocaeensis TaxID=1870988 RepID=UPI001956A3EB|nr:hypothetical protein [Pseudoflavonifractor phocaeensis]MBM6724537.1 hypothetical protein [Pseudoflavonifractor phocaeensis]